PERRLHGDSADELSGDKNLELISSPRPKIPRLRLYVMLAASPRARSRVTASTASENATISSATAIHSNALEMSSIACTDLSAASESEALSPADRVTTTACPSPSL